MFQSPPKFALGPLLKGRPVTGSGKLCQFLQKCLSHISWYGLWMESRGLGVASRHIVVHKIAPTFLEFKGVKLLMNLCII